MKQPTFVLIDARTLVPCAGSGRVNVARLEEAEVPFDYGLDAVTGHDLSNMSSVRQGRARGAVRALLEQTLVALGT